MTSDYLQEIARLRAEVDRLRQLSVAQIADKKDALDAQRNDIARALWAEFADFFLTEDEPMCDMLGEVYRGKLGNIAKILKRKGIDVTMQ